MGTVTPIRKTTTQDENDFTANRELSNPVPRITQRDSFFRDSLDVKGPYLDLDEVDLSKGIIETRDLYPLHSENPILSTALQLLDEGVKYLEESIKMIDQNDLLASDDALQRFQAMLPELFCCRDLGDGFGAIVNSIFHSLVNLRAAPLNRNQLNAIRKVVGRIYSEPYISFEEATDEILLLEDIGFQVEPSYFKYAADMLNE
jgi:hypothetical protein